MNKKMISIIVPVFNEQEALPILYDELVNVFAGLPMYDYELIFINDGSGDNSWSIIQELARHDTHVKALLFSRNFGHQIALKAGYDIALGDAVITIDADMQHPPKIMGAMLRAWEDGAHIVYVRQRTRQHGGWLKKITAQLYYKVLDAISDVKIPADVADFRLLDKRVVALCKSDKQQAPFWRGMVAWTGFNHMFIEAEYGKRYGGTSGYSWRKMIKLACDGVAGFSLFPLKIAAYVGIFVIVSGLIMFLYITLDALVHEVYYPLFKWLVTVIYIFMGVQFLLMWLLGEYIGRIYEQQKERPLYIVKETINMDDIS